MMFWQRKIGLLHTEVLVPAAGGEAGLGRVGMFNNEPYDVCRSSVKKLNRLKVRQYNCR